MPDRSREITSERSDRKRISSAVVVSKSFQKVREKRSSPEPRRERRNRQRSPDNVPDSDRRSSRLYMDRDENREGRRERITERLGPRNRRRVDHDESKDGKEDETDRLKQRRERFSRQGRSPPAAMNAQRRTVFDRLDPGPIRGRGGGQQGGVFRDQRMIEIDVNPQDVPRGKRYFMHDDREVPRRQKTDRLRGRSRGRSRSPVWVHDKFDECEGEDDQEQTRETQTDREEIMEEEREIRQETKERPLHSY